MSRVGRLFDLNRPSSSENLRFKHLTWKWGQLCSFYRRPVRCCQFPGSVAIPYPYTVHEKLPDNGNVDAFRREHFHLDNVTEAGPYIQSWAVSDTASSNWTVIDLVPPFLVLTTMPNHPSKTYREVMYDAGLGLALYEPEPKNYDHIRVGDVGFVKQGAFTRLFNACFEADDPANKNSSLPEPYKSISPAFRGVSAHSHLDPGPYMSYAVKDFSTSVSSSTPEGYV